MARLGGIGWDWHDDGGDRQRDRDRKEQAEFDKKVIAALRNPKVVKKLLEIVAKANTNA